MVLKKRSSVSAEEEEPKKRRKEEKVDEPSDKKKNKKNKEYVVKVKGERLSDDDEEEEEEEVEEEEIDEEEIPFELERKDDGDQPQWPQADMYELFSRIEALIPSNDTLSFATRAERLDWDEVAFKNYTPAECKNVWSQIQKKIRRYRILKEVIADARLWLRKPWTSFYSGSKQNHHPDMPRRPLTQYMVYYLEKKEKVATQHPDLDMTNLSKLIARMYKALPPHKKEKYVQKAAALRDEYVEKMRIFNEKHPEFRETKIRSKDSRSQSQLPGGFKKPRTPQQMFIDDRLEKMKDDPKFERNVVMENAKQQWKSLSEKKKLVWINWALEEESKYLENLKMYKAENPHFELPPHKSVLKKEELLLKDRAAGKPSKPPNSAYSMYSRIMLAKCPNLRELVPKSRMKEISRRWQQMPESEKAEYAKKVKYEQDRYKLEYATYLESLTEEERQEELMKNQTKKKKPEVEVEPKPVNNGKKANKSKKSSRKDNAKKFERQYFPGEPHQPPVNAFDLFVESFVTDTKLSATEAPRFWEMLPNSDKAKFQRKLKELKEKYIKDYKKFLKSLDEEEVAKYNDLQKRNKEREAAAEALKAQNSDDDMESDGNDGSSSEDEAHPAANNVANENDDSESDENEEKKSESSSDSSSGSSSGSSSSGSSSDDSDSSSDDSDDEGKKTNQNNVKKENSDSDSSDDE